MAREYHIPVNILQSNKIFNGLIEIRNLIEAVILAIIGFLICKLIPMGTDKFTLYFCVCMPLGFLGLVGIQGQPLSVFIKSFIHWCRNRKPYIYNPHGKAYDTTYGNLIMNEIQLRDKIGDLVDKLKESMQDNKTYIEGETYRYATDPSWEYMEKATMKQKTESTEPTTDAETTSTGDAESETENTATTPTLELDLTELIDSYSSEHTNNDDRE